MLQIVRIMDELPEALEALREPARTEGFRQLDRLYADWQSGAERFDKPGEVLFMAVLEGDCVAVGGLTREPTDPNGNALRARRLYVLPAHRRTGIGTALAGAIVQEGLENAARITVHAGPGAGAFWEAMGFARTGDEPISHELRR
jgi:GNAT superfamily N-acetyltransferase